MGPLPAGWVLGRGWTQKTRIRIGLRSVFPERCVRFVRSAHFATPAARRRSSSPTLSMTRRCMSGFPWSPSASSSATIRLPSAATSKQEARGISATRRFGPHTRPFRYKRIALNPVAGYHDPAILALIEELPPVPRPDRPITASGGYLPSAFAGRSRRREHRYIDIMAPGLGGRICHPPAVGRNRRSELKIRLLQKWFRRPQFQGAACPLDRRGPEVGVCPWVVPSEREPLTV